MVRIATVNDAEQLNILNDEFNGESETSIDNIRNSLMNNKQEVVIVADEDDMLVGFVCVQLKKSFCYDEYMPEITEVYVISLLFLNISAQSTVFAGVAVGIIFLFFGFYKTETGIKNKFLDDKF